jgi:uncharacterized membrane protein YphA (DoxX/SURF4 family)
MPVGKLFAIGLPIALGVVMIGAGAVNFVGPKSVRDSFVRWGYPAGFHRVTGGLEAIAGLLLLVPATSWAGAMSSVVILVAAVITLIRCREWGPSARRRRSDCGGGNGGGDPWLESGDWLSVAACRNGTTNHTRGQRLATDFLELAAIDRSCVGQREIDRLMSIVSETNQIVDRRNSLLNSKARIADGSARRFFAARRKIGAYNSRR